MSAEVSGADEGVTLLELLRSGEIAHPGRVNMGGWNRWRAGLGRRPTRTRDGRVTTPAAEGRMLQQAMELLDEYEAGGLADAPDFVPPAAAEGGGALPGVGAARDEEDDEEELIRDGDGAGSQSPENSPMPAEEEEGARPAGQPPPIGGQTFGAEDVQSEAGSGSLRGTEGLAAQVKIYDPAKSAVVTTRRI